MDPSLGLGGGCPAADAPRKGRHGEKPLAAVFVEFAFECAGGQAGYH